MMSASVSIVAGEGGNEKVGEADAAVGENGCSPLQRVVTLSRDSIGSPLRLT